MKLIVTYHNGIEEPFECEKWNGKGNFLALIESNGGETIIPWQNIRRIRVERGESDGPAH